MSIGGRLLFEANEQWLFEDQVRERANYAVGWRAVESKSVPFWGSDKLDAAKHCWGTGRTMQSLLQHIDAIARSKGRGVLFLTFVDESSELFHVPDFEGHPARTEIIKWLDENRVAWSECAGFANPNALMPYAGQIYIDLPFDNTLPEYRKLEAFLERPDGTLRFDKVQFRYLPLDVALKNAEHDESGFWDKWAENF